MIISAFTRFAGRVTEHSDIEGASSDPVRVDKIDSSGATILGELPEGPVVIYDLEETIFHEEVSFEPASHLEIEEGAWVETFDRVVTATPETLVTTYAVVVASE